MKNARNWYIKKQVFKKEKWVKKIQIKQLTENNGEKFNNCDIVQTTYILEHSFGASPMCN